MPLGPTARESCASFHVRTHEPIGAGASIFATAITEPSGEKQKISPYSTTLSMNRTSSIHAASASSDRPGTTSRIGSIVWGSTIAI